MTYVTKIKSNFKGAGEQDFSRCTLITGKSGQGKSALVDSYALAILGEARTEGLGKAPADLMRCVPEGETGLGITAILADGSNVTVARAGATLDIRPSRREFPTPLGIDYGAVVQGLLLGQEAKIAKAIVEAADHKLAWHRIEAVVAESKAAALLGAFHETKIKVAYGAEGAPVASQTFEARQIGEVVDWLKKEQRAINKELKADQAATEAPGAELTAAEHAELEELEKLQQQIKYLPKDAEGAMARLTELGRADQAAQAELATLPTYDEAMVTEARRQLEMMRHIHAIIGEILPVAQQGTAAFCPLCTAALHASHLQHQQATVADGANQLLDWVAQAERTMARQAELQRGLTQNAQQRKHFEELVTQGTVSQTVDADRIAALRRRAQDYDRAKAALARLPKTEQRLETTKTLAKALDGLLAQAVTDSVGVIERRINKFLPKAMRAKVDPSGKAISMSTNGTDGPYIHYRALSRAQRTILGLGLAAAMIPKDAPPVRALVIDDVAMDTATAKSLLNAIAAHIARGDGFSQAVVSLIQLSGKAPNGWTVIALDSAPKQGRRTEPTEPEEEEEATDDNG